MRDEYLLIGEVIRQLIVMGDDTDCMDAHMTGDYDCGRKFDFFLPQARIAVVF